MTGELVELAATWHQQHTWSTLLTYRGVPLGTCMEIDLLPYIVAGLQSSQIEK
jgi:hypothetical protein